MLEASQVSDREVHYGEIQEVYRASCLRQKGENPPPLTWETLRLTTEAPLPWRLLCLVAAGRAP